MLIAAIAILAKQPTAIIPPANAPPAAPLPFSPSSELAAPKIAPIMTAIIIIQIHITNVINQYSNKHQGSRRIHRLYPDHSSPPHLVHMNRYNVHKFLPHNSQVRSIPPQECTTDDNQG